MTNDKREKVISSDTYDEVYELAELNALQPCIPLYVEGILDESASFISAVFLLEELSCPWRSVSTQI